MRSALTAVATCIVFSSCGLVQTVTPAKPTAFLTSTGTDTDARIARLPFEHSWRDPSIAITDYKNIVVRPVTTKYLRVDEWERSKSTEIPNQRAFEKRVAALARHFTKQLNIAFSDPICVFYKTTDTSKPNTLILEVALTDAHFPDKDRTEIPVCGFEARVRDAQTGKIISTASDRRGPDLHLSGESSHITDTDEICAIWARQLMEASNKEIFANVRRKLITIESAGSHE
jgi:hypothetical protein